MKLSLRKQLAPYAQRRIQIERRRSNRITPVHRPLCLIQPTNGERTTGLIHDISRHGVSVLAEHAYAPGTLLHLLLVNEEHTASLNVDLNVVRSAHMGDRYLTAGTFARLLSHEEIVPFIL